MSGAVPLLALYAVMLSTGTAFFFYTGACSAWCPVGLLNYVLRTEVIAYLSYSAGVNNLQFYAHSSYWDFVKCCLGTD
jgi:polyferredoxin